MHGWLPVLGEEPEGFKVKNFGIFRKCPKGLELLHGDRVGGESKSSGHDFEMSQYLGTWPSFQSWKIRKPKASALQKFV